MMKSIFLNLYEISYNLSSVFNFEHSRFIFVRNFVYFVFVIQQKIDSDVFVYL